MVLGTRHGYEPLCLGFWGIRLEWCCKILLRRYFIICFFWFFVSIDSFLLNTDCVYLVLFMNVIARSGRWQFHCTGILTKNFTFLGLLEWLCFSSNSSTILLCRTMSMVKSHLSSGENFFMVIVRFLETFVGSMSAGHFLVLFKFLYGLSIFKSSLTST